MQLQVYVYIYIYTHHHYFLFPWRVWRVFLQGCRSRVLSSGLFRPTSANQRSASSGCWIFFSRRRERDARTQKILSILREDFKFTDTKGFEYTQSIRSHQNPIGFRLNMDQVALQNQSRSQQWTHFFVAQDVFVLLNPDDSWCALVPSLSFRWTSRKNMVSVCQIPVVVGPFFSQWNHLKSQNPPSKDMVPELEFGKEAGAQKLCNLLDHEDRVGSSAQIPACLEGVWKI